VLILEENIGTAKDNLKEPIHSWYKFTAGYSFKLVEEVAKIENLDSTSLIFDPFSGCGTTLVTAQKLQIPAVGNEAQEFMFQIILGKLNWEILEKEIVAILYSIERKATSSTFEDDYQCEPHDLLKTLYSEINLRELYYIKGYLKENVKSEETRNFLFLALSQTLHKTCIHPISIPYIVRTKIIKNPGKAFETFKSIVESMLEDVSKLKGLDNTSSIFLHDSREENISIKDNSVDCCITSPPYLNNLDYGEISKVHSHFFNITSSWNDITEKVRKTLVTGSTTHYKKSEFSYDDFIKTEFFFSNEALGERLIKQSKKLCKVSAERGGKKSFDVLMLYYFQDMFKVLKEVKRVLKKGKKAYLVVGDSAPYGEFIPTTEILGQIGISLGFVKYEVLEVRKRGNKWNSLKHRHNKQLGESLLILE